MKIRKSFLKALPLAIAMIFLAGCVDEFDQFTPDPASGDIDEFFSSVPESSENFIVDNTSGRLLVTDRRSLIHIPSGAFVDAAGNAADGNILFKVTELHDIGSYILNKVPTVSDGRLLESDGVFRLQALKDGENLSLAPGKSIKFQIPDENPNRDMGLFYGAIGSDSLFNWTTVDNATTGSWTNVGTAEWAFQDSLNSWFDYGYEFFTDSLTWINVDIFVDVPENQKTEVCVEIPELYTNENTVVYLVFKDISSVVALRGDADKMQFCEPYGLVPIGYEVCFVVISSQGDETFHFAIKEATIEENHNEFIVPEETSLEDILELLGKL